MVDNFSQAVLGGLAIKQWSDARLTAATGIPVERLEAVRLGPAEFDDGEIVRIEDATDLTGGQLACLVTEPGGGPLTEMAESGAAFRRSVEDVESRSRPRPIRPARSAG